MMDTDQKKSTSSWFKVRYLVSFLAFLSLVNLYAMRINLSIALVAMVKTPKTEAENDENVCPELAKKQDSSGNVKKAGSGEFDWDPTTQAHILSAFFYGDFFTPIPAGILATRYSAMWVLGGGVLLTGIFTLLTPVAARLDPWALFFVRFVIGMGTGVGFPCIHTMVGKWIPINERSLQLTIIFNGVQVGNILSLIFSGMLIKSGFLGGWPSVFYVTGLMTVTWFIFWIFLVYESPHDHPFVLKEELITIMGGEKEKPKRGPIPWKSIATSIPFHALCVTHFCNNFGYYTMLTYLPTYMHQVLHLPIEKDGFISALPYITSVLFSIPVGILVDKVRGDGRIKITTLRKLSNSVGLYIPGICLLLVPFIGCYDNLIIVLLALTAGFNGFKLSGFEVTHIDMSPEFGGVLMSGTNTFANIGGIITPLFVGHVQQQYSTLDSWKIVFSTAGVMYLIGGTVYNVLCSAKLQEWGITKQPSEENDANQESVSDNSKETSDSNNSDDHKNQETFDSKEDSAESKNV